MKSIRELHKKAMDLAEMAFVAKLRGNLEKANQLSRQAFKNEAQAAKLVPNEPSSEPTRSVLYRSAASLALDCKKHHEAEQLIVAGLAGHPPEEIAEELREMLEKVNFQQGKSDIARLAQHLEPIRKFLPPENGAKMNE